MSEHQRSYYNWEIVFLASELSTHTMSRRMGVAEEKSMRWMKSSEGTVAAFMSMDAEILKARKGREKDLDFLSKIQD